MLGLEQAKPGNHLGDISHAIQTHAEKHRYGVVRDFCGHGWGKSSTTRRRSCMSAAPGPAPSYARACSSPSSR
jgi:methionyl aminopeptidase